MTKKSISNVFIWQLLGRFALQGIAFITVPVFTRIMTPSDYGQYAVYSSWLGILSLLIGLQTSGSIANAKVKYIESEYKQYLSSALTISFCSFVIVLITGIILKNWLGKILGFESYLIILMIIQSFFNYCYNFYLIILIQDKESKKNAIISTIVSASGTLLALLFVVKIDFSKYALKALGYAIPEVLIGFVCFILILVRGKSSFNGKYWSFCLNFSLPLILHGASLLIIAQSDRIMLKAFCGEASAGIYSVGYNLALIVSIIMSTFNTSWIPFYLEYEKQSNYEEIKHKSNNYIINFTTIVIGFILCCPEVFKLIAPEEYWSGINLLPIIATAYYFNFLYTFPGNFELCMEKTKHFSTATIIAAVINIVGNYCLIPNYGIIGAGIATLAAYIFLLFIHDFFARILIKEKKYPYSWKFYLFGMIPVLIMAILYYFLLNLVYLRWGVAIGLGIFLLNRFIKNKSVF